MSDSKGVDPALLQLEGIFPLKYIIPGTDRMHVLITAVVSLSAITVIEVRH